MTAPSMTFMEQLKDKASGLLPSPFAETVERTTSGIRAVPDYDGALFLCDAANTEEDADDVVRAIRRRLADPNGKVQYFTLFLLDMIIKNGYGVVHVAVAENKGLLHELVKIALTPFPSESQREAKRLALTLILSASKWFAGYPNPRCRVFTELPDVVRRSAADPQVFDDIEMDSTIRLHTEPLPPRRRAPAPVDTRRPRQEQFSHRRPQSASSSPPPASARVVQAIPIIVPTDEAATGMLDACMVLAECLADAEAEKQPLTGNELTSNLVAQIRHDHAYLAMLVASGYPLPNPEVLLTVLDGQKSIVQRFDSAIRHETAHLAESAAPPSTFNDAPPSPPPAASEETPAAHTPVPVPAGRRARHVDAAGDVEMTSFTGVRQAADIDDPTSQRPYHQAAVPNVLDSLFESTPPPPAVVAPPSMPPSAVAPQPVVAPQPAAVPQSAVAPQPAAAAPSHEAPSHGSLNDEGDDFDAFLNRRLSGA